MNEALVLDDDFSLAKLRLEIFTKFQQLSRTYSSWLRADAPGLNDLHANERVALRLIAMSEITAMSQLALDLNLGLSGTSKIVQRLEQLGLCFRDQLVEDTRHKVIHFVEDSELGQIICNQLSSLAADMEWKFAAMTRTEAETLLSLIKKL